MQSNSRVLLRVKLNSSKIFRREAESGKRGMTESSAELFSKTSEMVPNCLNIPTCMYES